MNLPLSDYISMVRINKAKSYLANTDYSIEIISQKVGYSSISSFSRFFKNNVGMSPLKYRKITET
ncbi:helix-turn-helix domain-containing protein [Muricoprocola aceti]|uniref:helix-turn-helix domain-containing protein n=1 Tax=Muricoprocola aceti TaxID=2981772 RepID=UPI003A859E8D